MYILYCSLFICKKFLYIYYIYDRDAEPNRFVKYTEKNNSLTNYENLHKILIFFYIFIINFSFSLCIIQISINLRNIYLLYFI